MIRRLSLGPIVFVLCLAAYCYMVIDLQARDYISASNLDLWGRTLMANGGLSRFEDVVTAFPPLPYIVTIAAAATFPALGAVTPELIGALLAALLVVAWFLALRRNHVSRGHALLGTVALAANPLFLRALSEGPGFILLLWGLWFTALGVFGLRRGQRVNDLILISLGMALMAFAHPFGIIVVFAMFPFLALVVPADRMRDAPASMFLVLLFPLAFSILAFCYVNWVFAGDALSFAGRISRESAGLGPDWTPPAGLQDWMLAFFSLFAACPIAIAMFVRAQGMAPLRFAVLVLFATLIAAIVLGSLFGVLPATALVASLALAVAAACAARWPVEHAHRSRLALLLVAGFLGGVVVTFADDKPETQRWRGAMAGERVAPADPELAELGALLATRDAILFDADRAPAVIAERRSTRGVWSAGTQEFRLTALSGRSSAQTVVVQNRDLGIGSDQVGQMLPEVYEDRPEGFREIYSGKRWRVFATETGSGL